MDITFFSQPTMEASELGRFVEQIEIQTSLNQADIQTSAHAISISFTSSSSFSTPFRLQLSCKQINWQLSLMSQICNQFTPPHIPCKNVGININTAKLSNGQDEVGGEQWLELVRSFGGARNLWVAGKYTTDILCALRSADEGHTTDLTVLPALRNHCVQNPMPVDGSFCDAAQSLITSRGFSGPSLRVANYVPQLPYQFHTAARIQKTSCRHACIPNRVLLLRRLRIYDGTQ
jgi:hypothetical protein